MQLYLHDKVRSITPPMKELKGFQKIFLEKGASKTVNFEINTEDLKFYNSDLEYVFESGEFEFFVGGTSNLEPSGTFSVE